MPGPQCRPTHNYSHTTVTAAKMTHASHTTHIAAASNRVYPRGAPQYLNTQSQCPNVPFEIIFKLA